MILRLTPRQLPRQQDADVRIRSATAHDAPEIARIHNEGIVDRSATFDTELRSAEDRVRWIAEREPRFAVLVAERTATTGEEVVGWAALAPYSTRPCYHGVADFSIYVGRSARGEGVGKVLLQALIDAAEREGFWKLTSRLLPHNAASRGLHARLGFREVGVYQKHARLDGRWVDAILVERLIPENQR